MLKFFKGMRQGHSVVSHYLNGTGSVKNPDHVGIPRGLLLWAGMVIGLIGLLFGFDFVGDALEEFVTLVFEFVQETLETLYRKQFKLELYQAQMATAYTVFFIVIGVGYFLVGKLSLVFRKVQHGWQTGRGKAWDLYVKYLTRLGLWWESMDGFNKCFALIGFVVVAIPLVSIVCMVLGRMVAELV